MVLPFTVFSEPHKPNTPEEELGEAITKFFSQGVKTHK